MKSRKLKIYADRNYVPHGAGHVMMLFPFWGKGHPSNGRFARYSEIGHSFFEMSSLDEADFCVLPVAWELVADNSKALSLAHEFAQMAKSAGKKVVVFFWSDSDEEVPIENATVFRTSLYRSKRRTNEYAMPAWGEDFVTKYFGGHLPIYEKSVRPILGFCGFAYPMKTPLERKLKTAVKRTAGLLGIEVGKSRGQVSLTHAARSQALRTLSESALLETNFIIRDGFLGGARLADGREDPALLKKAQGEYVENMMQSNYVLCSRGAGNFSYRLYETLSCGRVPVFVDTDCVLPYDFAIDWRRYCVWVDESEISMVAEKVVEFHERLSSREFVRLQHECRELWEQWLSPEGFFANLHRHFSDGWS